MRMAGSGFQAATIPMQNSRITTITDTITIPVQAVITAAVLMVAAAADMAGIEPRTTRTTRTCLTTKTQRHQFWPQMDTDEHRFISIRTTLLCALVTWW